MGGPVADAGADLLVPLQEEVWSRSRGLLGRDVPLVEQQVADRSGIVSAAGLVMAPAPDYFALIATEAMCFSHSNWILLDVIVYFSTSTGALGFSIFMSTRPRSIEAS